ncbi:hypothetical protein DCAR_0521656 [Daucus carota subsp. sativus]|uniref:Uncharacterized protein n=1 Tax=Daucus carota subsp. sativus TaxID=79200 RepID=A0AAF0X879_DAUCS|nr:hypothetical protein DCAR_0521656 [Daucus carota subsp. sativus]
MEEKMNYEHGSSAESVFSGFGSSSGLNTPAGSDLDSLESEEDDFMAELTRKMAENMLLEDDNKTTPVSPNDRYICNGLCTKAHFQHQPRNREYGYAHARRPGVLSAAQAGSGMRVVFLGSKNGSSGTGVFLPSQATNNNNIVNPAYDHQYRKKPVCSTVLVPERVLQTLKQHFEKRSNAHGGLQSHTQQNQRLQSQENHNQELQLPQEWTY